MKRVVTAFVSLIVLAIIPRLGSAQTIASHRAATHTSVSMPAISQAKIAPAPSSGLISPFAVTKTDAVSYFQDTTGDNWWLYAPIFSAGPDSLGYIRFGTKLYQEIQDSIGPLEVNLGGGQTQTVFDTMYTRSLGLRISTPTDISATTARLDSASITVLPINMSSRDSLVFWAVPIEDVQFSRGGTVTGTYPIPNLFGTPIGKGAIRANQFTVGDINTVTVNFNHKLIGRTHPQFAICVFVDGPDFVTDTVAYMFDANLQQAPASAVDIDTDGTLGIFSGPSGSIPMRTYLVNLDAGHQMLNGTASLIGGAKTFFWGLNEFDPATGQPTGQTFAGNLAMTTYISGTSLGVDDANSKTNSLQPISPNPAGASATIAYSLEKSGSVLVKVYNAVGDEVATVVNGVEAAGPHTVTLNTTALPNGMYYYRLQSGSFSATQNLVISK